MATLADRYINFIDLYDPYRDTSEPITENLSEMLYNLEEIKKDFDSVEGFPDDGLTNILTELISAFKAEGIKRE
jgi:hypothetical protein